MTLLLTPLVFRQLGEIRFGLWSLMISVVGYYGLLDIGFRPGATKYLSAALANNDTKAGSEVLSSAFFSMASIAIVILLSAAPLASIASSLIKIDGDLRKELYWCSLIMGLGTAIQFSLSVFSSVLVACERFDISNTTATCARLTYATTAIFLLKNGCGLISLSIALNLINVLEYILRAYLARREVPLLSIHRSAWSIQTTKRLLSFGTWMSLASAGSKIAQYSDTLIIGTFVSAIAIAPYSLAASLSGYISRIIMPMSMILFPAAVKLAVNAGIDQLETLYLKATRIILCTSISVTSVATYYCLPFLAIWLENSASEETVGYGATAFTILAITLIAHAYMMTGKQIVMAMGKPKWLAFLLLPESILNVVISISLATRFGMLGVAFGTLISSSLFNFLLHPLIVARLLKIPAYRIHLEILPRATVLTALIALYLYVVDSLFGKPNTWLELLSHSTVTVFLAIILTCVITFRNEERKAFLLKLNSRFKTNPSL